MFYPLVETAFHYSVEFWLAVSMSIIFTILFTGIMVYLMRYRARGSSDYVNGRYIYPSNIPESDIGLVRAIAAVILIVFWIGGTILAYAPFDKDYYGWHRIEGSVAVVNSRILYQTEKFVVTIDGTQYGCNDTRCANIQVGDYVVLNCTVDWDWNGTDGWDCKYIEDRGRV